MFDGLTWFELVCFGLILIVEFDVYYCVNSVVYAPYLPQFSILVVLVTFVCVDCWYSGLLFGLLGVL